MDHANGKDDEKKPTFVLEVVRTPGKSSNIELKIINEPEAGSARGLEKDPAPAPLPEQVSDSDRALKELQKLSSTWTTTAIGFFEVVPSLNAKNFEIVEDRQTEKLIEFGKSKSTKYDYILTDEGQELHEFELPFNELFVVIRKLGKSYPAIKAAETMSRAALGALVAEYESFMGDLLRALAILNPGAFIGKDDIIKLDEVLEFQSISDLKGAQVEKKIESILHNNSHLELLKVIEEKFGVNLSSNEILLAEFAEVCQRRHVHIHNSGRVSRRYLDYTKEFWKSKDVPELNSELPVSRKYLRGATARIFQVGFFTLHILWQKILPNHKDESISAILETSHDFLESDLTKMTDRICHFAVGEKARKSSIDQKKQAYFVINWAQSFLFAPDLSEADRKQKVAGVLRQHDFSMADPIVNLALACLNRDFKNLAKNTKAAISAGLRYHDAMTWSIFREVRELPDFLDQFKN